MTEQEIIQGCRDGDKRAQEKLYRSFSPRMFGVCKRYLSNSMEAEDAVVMGFYKVFTHIADYDGKGSFEGWVRKIMVNECLMILRKRDALRYAEDITKTEVEVSDDFARGLTAEEVKKLIDTLPAGCRTVFNLYAMEGYLHREIAGMLGISIGTSMSQLQLAVRKLKEKLSSSYSEVK